MIFVSSKMNNNKPKKRKIRSGVHTAKEGFNLYLVLALEATLCNATLCIKISPALKLPINKKLITILQDLLLMFDTRHIDVPNSAIMKGLKDLANLEFNSRNALSCFSGMFNILYNSADVEYLNFVGYYLADHRY